MKVTMLLADAAQAVGGKLYILGGGWSMTGPGPAPSAIALYLQVPWDRANERHQLSLQLLDSDGEPVLNDADDPIQIEGEFETGRPPGLKRGSPLDFALAVGIPPLTLRPDSRFEWRLSIDGHSENDWRLPFSTRPAVPPGTMQQG
jgi:hypothetical protein